MKKLNTSLGGRQEVDHFMEALDHPLKAEVQMIREIIKVEKIIKQLVKLINQ
jgi:hypothetical protein